MRWRRRWNLRAIEHQLWLENLQNQTNELRRRVLTLEGTVAYLINQDKRRGPELGQVDSNDVDSGVRSEPDVSLVGEFLPLVWEEDFSAVWTHTLGWTAIPDDVRPLIEEIAKTLQRAGEELENLTDHDPLVDTKGNHPDVDSE